MSHVFSELWDTDFSSSDVKRKKPARAESPKTAVSFVRKGNLCLKKTLDHAIAPIDSMYHMVDNDESEMIE